jgi:BirA family biotin operon repressor/biotin-[acetyl-CoA-carboxylase] ligase
MSTPGKALCASFVLRPDWPADDAKRLAVLGGWAVYQALQRVGVPDLRIKWPNDVLSSGRKISGVLVEPLIARGRIEFAILGIGVNVQQEALDFPEELRSRAASCRMLGGTCSVEMVLDYLVEALAESRREPYEGVEARWKAAGADREATLE